MDKIKGLERVVALAALVIVAAAMLSGEESKPTSPYPGGMQADLWVLAGQSNMYGSASLPAELAPPDPRIQLFNMDNTWIPAQEPLHRIFEAAAPVFLEFRLNDGMTREQYFETRARSKIRPVGGVGPGLFFARRLAEFIDRPIGLIPNSPGGSNMDHWDPALRARGGESLYGAMMDRVEMVGGPIKGVLWYQGEGEAMGPGRPDVYEQALLNLIDSLRRDIGQPDLPILYVQISRWAKTNDPDADRRWEQVREIQRRVARMRRNVFMVPTIDLPLRDGIHLDYEAQKCLGIRLAEVALTHVYGQQGHAGTIDLESVRVLGPKTRWPEVRVRFSGVSGALRALGRPSGFELREPAATGRTSRIFRVDFDPHDPAVVILRRDGALEKPVQLFYGPAMDPYANITDEKGMALPAFGPIELDWMDDDAVKDNAGATTGG